MSEEVLTKRARLITIGMSLNLSQAELGEMENWQENSNAWEDESEAAWEAEEVLR